MAGASEELFDFIFLADNSQTTKAVKRKVTFRFLGEAYREGFDEGTRIGTLEGRTHGASHGAKISTEVSFYYGFALTWKCLLQNNMDAKSRKRLKSVEALMGLVKVLTYDNPQSEKLLDDLQKIRAKFRQVCSVLSVPTDFSDYTQVSSEMTF